MKEYVYTLDRVVNPSSNWAYYYLYVITKELFGTSKWCITSSSEEKTMNDLFNQFCNAKAAGMLHSASRIIVCEYISKKGKYRVTKQFHTIEDITYKIWRKCWFGWEEKFETNRKEEIDEYMPPFLQKFVEEGIRMMGQETVKKC
jgi:hypothetical protein